MELWPDVSMLFITNGGIRSYLEKGPVNQTRAYSGDRQGHGWTDICSELSYDLLVQPSQQKAGIETGYTGRILDKFSCVMTWIPDTHRSTRGSEKVL